MSSYPGAGCYDEGLHAGAGVVTLLFAESGVNDVDDAIYGEGGFCYIGSHHHLGLIEREHTVPSDKVSKQRSNKAGGRLSPVKQREQRCDKDPKALIY